MISSMLSTTWRYIALLVLGAAAVYFGLATPYHISGDCMEPAVKDGQWVFLNRLIPYLTSYRNGQIVAFTHEGRAWFSRIIANEGDSVQLSESGILLNGVLKSIEQDIPRKWSGWRLGTYGIDHPFVVPQGHVFVLSDNLLADHDDSRVFGPIAHKSILGLVWSF